MEQEIGVRQTHKCEEHGEDNCTVCHGLEPTIPEKAKVSDYYIGNIRQEGELYCDYKCRLYWENKLMKQYLHGKTMWEGKGRTMVNLERKRRVSKKRTQKDAQIERKQALSESQGKRTPEQVRYWNRKRKQAQDRIAARLVN